MIVITRNIDGNQRYSWIENQRPLFVSRTRPCSLRLKTFNRCRSTAFSASSRGFDLNGRGQDGQSEAEQPDHPASLDNSHITLGWVFGAHNPIWRPYIVYERPE